MKMSLLAVATIVGGFIGQAQAANLGTTTLYTGANQNASKIVSLRDCNGVLEITRNGIFVVDNDNCTNVLVNGTKVKAEEGFFTGVRRALVSLLTVAGRENIYDVTIQSNSKKTSDSLQVVIDDRYVYSGSGVVLTSGQTVNLPNCGGTLQFQVQNGQANLKLKGLKQCSNFDILSNDGQSIKYPNQKVGTEDNRSGSFTLPKAVLDYGVNGVKVIVKSNSGKTSDTVKLVFLAL